MKEAFKKINSITKRNLGVILNAEDILALQNHMCMSDKELEDRIKDLLPDMNLGISNPNVPTITPPTSDEVSDYEKDIAILLYQLQQGMETLNDELANKLDKSDYIGLDQLPEWLKSEEKPTYTAEEVGAAPKLHTHPEYITSNVLTDRFYTKPLMDLILEFYNHAHLEYCAKVEDIPTAVSQLENDSEYVTKEDLVTNEYVTKGEVPTKVSQLTNDSRYITIAQVPKVDLEPYVLKTDLPELPDFNDFATTVFVADNFQVLEEGKGLSTNDFTDELKTKLEDIELYDDSELTSRVSSLEDTYNALVGTEDLTDAIDNVGELINFLDTFKNTDTLAGALDTLKTDVQGWVNEQGFAKTEDIKDESTTFEGHYTPQAPGIEDGYMMEDLSEGDPIRIAKDLKYDDKGHIYDTQWTYIPYIKDISKYALKTDIVNDSTTFEGHYTPSAPGIEVSPITWDLDEGTSLTIPANPKFDDKGHLYDVQWTKIPYISSLAAYAKKTDIPTNYLTLSDLENYALKTEIPSNTELTQEDKDELVLEITESITMSTIQGLIDRIEALEETNRQLNATLDELLGIQPEEPEEEVTEPTEEPTE